VPLALFIIGYTMSAILIHISNTTTNQYLSTDVKYQILSLDIYHNIGYGKGIHAFKNYVLRHSISDKIEAEQSFQEADRLVKKYLTFPSLSTEEKTAMEALEKTIELYLSKIPIAENLIKEGKSISQIDHRVKIDDNPAVKAIFDLQNYYIKQRDLKLKNLKAVQDKVSLIMLITFTISMIIAILTSRKTSRAMLKAIQKVLNISNSISNKVIDVNTNLKTNISSEMQNGNDELDELASRVTLLGENLEASFSELKRKNTELENYAFITSHDLQEPVKKISTYADIILLENKSDLAPKSVEDLKKIKNLTLRLTQLIKSLLEYAQLNESQDNLQDVDLNQIAKEAVDNLEIIIKETHADIEIHPLPTVRGNHILLRSLFQNLISNSLKFQNTNTISKVKIFSEIKDKNCKITVTDNGIGFDIKYLDKILRPFGRYHDKKKYPGSGIGLATCKKIAEIHNSSLEVLSEENKGSSFSFNLKLLS
ncbi:MAG: hypothetical protein KDD45_03380, partial [Bdellovibrionales bacterium]|nr:hypothetical protein [Bdellovibrionales bacterium]